MSRRRKALKPSLFPFLAVLVCTLGTLILLLALVAQNATGAAEQNAREQQVAEARIEAAKVASTAPPRLTAASVEELIQEERFRVTQLIAFRDQQTADMEDRRDSMTHLDDHIQRLRERLKRLNDEVDRAMGETETEQVEEETLIALRASLERERQKVETLRSEAANQTPRVVIVPHKGPNGTDRRPVYLECTADGVYIRPEGTLIAVPQLENSSRSANPLDAALRVIRLHAMKTYGDTAPPYPLLVVRPDGIQTYGAARKAMKDWDDQFGYELVPANIQLAYSESDQNLKNRIEVAVREATIKQRSRIAYELGPGGSERAPNSRQIRAGRGGARERFPTLSAAALDASGRNHGFRSHPGDTISSSSSYDSQHRSKPKSAYTGGNGYSAEPAETDLPTREWDQQMQSAASELRRQGKTQVGVDNEISNDAPAMQSLAGETTRELNSRPFSSPLPFDQNQASAEDSSSAASSRGESDQSQRTSTDASSGSANSSSKASSRATSAGSQAASPSSSTQAGAPNRSHQNQAAPQTTVDLSPQQQELVKRSGSDWALPNHMAGQSGNSIVRTIRVECFTDRFVLIAPASGGATQVFGFSDADVDHASLQLATAVRDRIERWGAALPGGSWLPTLEVQVAPGGEDRFYQLKSLLQNSGVDVIGRSAR
ncbi:MAG: hypothetical protein AB8B91_05095 [Rubripirellula sp.]